MKAVAKILYEVDVNEVLRLPFAHTVLLKSKNSETVFQVLQAQIDEIPINTSAYEYYLFTPPELKINPEYLVKDEA